MTTLALIQKCDEDTCPIAEKCPIGPTPNIVCALKQKHMAAVQEYVREIFPDIDDNPLMRMSAEFSLIPLHSQLMSLYLAEHALPSPLIGYKINPIMKEIRSCINDIQKAINNMIKLDENKIERMISVNDVIENDSNKKW